MCNKDASLRKDLAKQFPLFKANRNHPSLRLHKLIGSRSEQYAIWIRGDLRALGICDGDEFVFFDLVTHDEY